MTWVGNAKDLSGRGLPTVNGEALLMYPPKACFRDDGSRTEGPVMEGPVSSIRAEHLRDGIEDYEYFAMLRKVDPESALLSVPREITSSLDDYSTDPAGMEAYRLRLAEAIERSTLQNINKSNRRMKP